MDHRKNNTEDDELKEIVEERLLRVNARLLDGSSGKVFSVLPTERGPQWRCHACQVTVLGSREIYKHERSKDHARVMVETKAHSPENFREQSLPPPPHQTLLEMSLAPGEPVPPGFEGEVRGIAEIQKKLDAFTSSPLIGLEYLFELHSYDDKEPHYICILCDKRGDPRTVMAHLNSFNHRMKFIESHFPKVNQTMQKYRSCKEYKKVCQSLITTIADYIEKRFGRLVPHACDKDSFERKRESYTQIVVKDVHFSDKYGETLEELVHEKLFESAEDHQAQINHDPSKPIPGCKPPEIIKRRSPSPPIVNAPGKNNKQRSNFNNRNPTRRSDKSPLSSVSSLSFSGDSSPEHSSKFDTVPRRPRDREMYEKYKLERERRRSRSRSGSFSRFRSKRRYRSRSLSQSPPPKGGARFMSGRFPWKRNDYVQAREKTDSSIRKKLSLEAARWEEYKKGIIKIEDELEHVLRNHEKNPEKHPQYPEEWKKFWNRRYKELQAEHKDPSKHDFKPEWIDFWNKRMKEMHESELKARKESLRKRLNLPDDQPQPIKFKIGARKPGGSSSNEIPASSSDDVIVIEDAKDDDLKPQSRRTISKERYERKRSHSPWEPDYAYSMERYPPKRDYYNAQRMPEMRPKKYMSHSVMESRHEEPEDDDAQLNIVAVLRLLTALEEKLGSLGPKVIDMLSTALAMEKTEANSAETLLDNDVHCVLFETVKEKLKGQLLAGLIEPQAEKPAKNAIKRIAALLHISSERKRKREETLKQINISKPKPLSVPGIGEVDKEAIAKQITAALLTQGRTNVTQAELEQLIGAVVGMAQAKSSGQNVTTAQYVDKMKNSEPEKVKTITPSSASSSALLTLQSSHGMDSSAMDGLSDSDLKTLLQNFKDLSTDEQHGLISYLKKLEAHEPERVERLRKFVNLEPSKSASETSKDEEKHEEIARSPTPEQKSIPPSQSSRSLSPFSKRCNDVVDITSPSHKPDVPDKFDQNSNNSGFVKIDSDEDDDYTYEDVFKAASKNVKDKEDENNRNKEKESSSASTSNSTIDPNIVLKDAKLMIANIMGQLGQKNANSSNAITSASNVLSDIPIKSSNLSHDTRPPINRPVIDIYENRQINRPTDLQDNRPSTNRPMDSGTGNIFRDFDNRPSPPTRNEFSPYSQNFDNNPPSSSQYANYSNFNNSNQSGMPFQQRPPLYNSNFQQGPPKSNLYDNIGGFGDRNPPFTNNGGISGNPFNNPYDQFGIPPQQQFDNTPSGNNYSNQNYDGPPGVGGGYMGQQSAGNYNNSNSYNYNGPPSFNNRNFY